ncbi:MAG: helix-turn-helix domain-containing protein [Pseudomonadota bacterium]
MDRPLRVQLLEYPGAQQSALWGMKDLLDTASSEAATVGADVFKTKIGNAPGGDEDIVILPPALLVEPPVLQTDWKAMLVRHHAAGGVLASVCAGAFLLADAGVLDGRRVTTHWRHEAALRERHPKVIIDTRRLLVDLGDVVTAGGVMAWTDLTLHMIQRFGGRKLMLNVARLFVLDPPEREQSYYATFTPSKAHGDSGVAKVQDLMLETVGETHTIASLAAAGAMSERSFLRRFKNATGETPVAYLQLLRVEAARSRLELTRESFEGISWGVGYTDAAAFRRIFKRRVGLTPSEYRARFGMGDAIMPGEGKGL